MAGLSEARISEWLPIANAPPNEDLEICVMDYDGIVQALRYPCDKLEAEWLDALNKERVDIQPTHWRRWAETTWIESLALKPSAPAACCDRRILHLDKCRRGGVRQTPIA